MALIPFNIFSLYLFPVTDVDLIPSSLSAGQVFHFLAGGRGCELF